jgi:hypothetical protein
MVHREIMLRCQKALRSGQKRTRAQKCDGHHSGIVLPAARSRPRASGNTMPLQRRSRVMTVVALSPAIKGRRVYHFEMPYHIPGIWMGMAIAKLKQLGVWERLPAAFRRKARAAQASWSSFAITRRDLDSIPDHDWEVIARRLKLRWRYDHGDTR